MASPSNSLVDTSNPLWYLGIDFGTTGLSAVVLNQKTGQHYPLYWQQESSTANRHGGESLFRLPTQTYSSQPSAPKTAPSVGVAASVSTWAKALGIRVSMVKPYLPLAIPYYCPERRQWEPMLRLPDGQVPLYWVRRSLQAMLATLTPETVRTKTPLQVGAMDLESQVLAEALAQLEGVIVSYPADWGDTYQINVREAVLAAKLVKESQQIVFLEDAIASLLAAFPTSEPVCPPLTPQSSTPGRGWTLVIDIGATTTELALVDLPYNLSQLTYADFQLQSWSYAGQAIDQDIIWQLLYPQMSEAQLAQLALSQDLERPLPGQPDPKRRDRALFELQHSALGQALLKAAEYLKLILPHKAEFTLELGTSQWTVQQKDFNTAVITPFIEQLNQQVNKLLIQAGLSQQAIGQAICTGGSAKLKKVKEWLQHKLPNAKLLPETGLPQTWVATGLAKFPLYPHVFNRFLQQYSDYFLLQELLKAFPPTEKESAIRDYTVAEIRQRLERQGLNTVACYERLLGFLDGELPSGLLPVSDRLQGFSATSPQNSSYGDLADAKLFSTVGDRLYRANFQQHERLRQYLKLLVSSLSQTFDEPLIINCNHWHK
ncbi:MAG: hypothetical protein RIM23_05750 [Coleofasciculus sp. G3-WIS-01]|uniref:hypothetical protein n=1 Tax=Coleofasciculus sp. G3-WIS-01 TaxID=3069528 RepID=UPI0032FFAA23